MVVRGARAVRAHAGEDIAIALLLLGQGGVNLLTCDAGRERGEHLRLCPGAVDRRVQVAGDHRVIDLEEEFAVSPVFQLLRLEVDLVVALVLLQHHNEPVGLDGGEVAVLIIARDLSVAVAVEIQLRADDRGGHRAVQADAVLAVIVEADRAEGQILHAQPDRRVAVVDLVVIENLVAGVAVEVDALDVFELPDVGQKIDDRIVVLDLDLRHSVMVLRDGVPEIRRLRGRFAESDGDVILAVGLELRPGFRDAVRVDVGGGLAVGVGLARNGRRQIQLHALQARHHHVDRIGILQVVFGHVVPDERDEELPAAALHLHAVHLAAVGTAHIDGDVQVDPLQRLVAVQLLQGHLELAADVKPAVRRHAAGAGHDGDLGLHAGVNAGALLQRGRSGGRGGDVAVPALAVVGGVDAQAQVVAERPAGQAAAGDAAVDVVGRVTGVIPRQLQLQSGHRVAVGNAPVGADGAAGGVDDLLVDAVLCDDRTAGDRGLCPAAFFHDGGVAVYVLHAVPEQIPGAR